MGNFVSFTTAALTVSFECLSTTEPAVTNPCPIVETGGESFLAINFPAGICCCMPTFGSPLSGH